MAEPTGPQRAEATELSRPDGFEPPMGADAPVMDVMATMRAMRRLKPDPVDPELLREIVEAATWAPSGSDAQQYGFVVVTDREPMAELAELWRSCVETYQLMAGTVVPDFDDDRHARMAEALRYQADHFADTPALIAACYQRSTPSAGALLDKRTRDLAKALGPKGMADLAGGLRVSANLGEASSIYPAVQNLLLAARAHGLAATMTIWHMFREKDFRRVLGLPKGVGLYALVPIGWPEGNFGPVRRRPVDEVLHWQKW